MEISREYRGWGPTVSILIKPTMGENVLDIVLALQNELVDNVKILLTIG